MKGKAVLDAIRGRRSLRGYQPGIVTRQDLEAIVDCGRLAPTGMNLQPWAFVVVTQREVLREIANIAPDNGPFIEDAMACIVVACDGTNRNRYLDGAAATQNMLLAIHAMDLASCWVQAYEKDYSQAIKDLLGIPAQMDLVSMVPVGVPFSDEGKRPKRPLKAVLHWEKY